MSLSLDSVNAELRKLCVEIYEKTKNKDEISILLLDTVHVHPPASLWLRNPDEKSKVTMMRSWDHLTPLDAELARKAELRKAGLDEKLLLSEGLSTFLSGDLNKEVCSFVEVPSLPFIYEMSGSIWEPEWMIFLLQKVTTVFIEVDKYHGFRASSLQLDFLLCLQELKKAPLELKVYEVVTIPEQRKTPRIQERSSLLRVPTFHPCRSCCKDCVSPIQVKDTQFTFYCSPACEAFHTRRKQELAESAAQVHSPVSPNLKEWFCEEEIVEVETIE